MSHRKNSVGLFSTKAAQERVSKVKKEKSVKPEKLDLSFKLAISLNSKITKAYSKITKAYFKLS
ncbi:hypothetical protein [Methanosarcina barkeri]|uniref:hypothetical protein n=1 Tax=Methanosarcina barkeri TaxID=2208 RepID=UPI00003C69A1|nr:hypothetical protein [Methanosarcina barkeri]